MREVMTVSELKTIIDRFERQIENFEKAEVRIDDNENNRPIIQVIIDDDNKVRMSFY
jgi:hypothetical protein